MFLVRSPLRLWLRKLGRSAGIAGVVLGLSASVSAEEGVAGHETGESEPATKKARESESASKKAVESELAPKKASESEPTGKKAVESEPAAKKSPRAAKVLDTMASAAPSIATAAHAPVLVPVPHDEPVLVFHAAKGVERAIVYLHGRCGRAESAGSWADETTHLGTVIALTGDRKCRGGGSYWSYDFRRLHRRIEAAVAAVAAAREGRLDTERLTLVGYSEGAARAEQLPRRHPSRYPWIVLAGTPTRPHPWYLEPARAVVIVGGSRDRTLHLRQGLKNLLAAGQLAAFMELPGARHGEYGPEGARVMNTALWWMYDRAP